MDVKRQLVLHLHKRGFRKVDIFRRLQNENFTKLFIHRTIKRYKEHGTVDIQKKIGRKRSVRTKKIIKCVREKIRRNCQRSANQLAKEHKVSDYTMRKIQKEDLGMTPFKKCRRHGLTIKNKIARKQRRAKKQSAATPARKLKYCFFR